MSNESFRLIRLFFSKIDLYLLGLLIYLVSVGQNLSLDRDVESEFKLGISTSQ